MIELMSETDVHKFWFVVTLILVLMVVACALCIVEALIDRREIKRARKFRGGKI